MHNHFVALDGMVAVSGGADLLAALMSAIPQPVRGHKSVELTTRPPSRPSKHSGRRWRHPRPSRRRTLPGAERGRVGSLQAIIVRICREGQRVQVPTRPIRLLLSVHRPRLPQLVYNLCETDRCEAGCAAGRRTKASRGPEAYQSASARHISVPPGISSDDAKIGTFAPREAGQSDLSRADFVRRQIRYLPWLISKLNSYSSTQKTNFSSFFPSFFSFW